MKKPLILFASIVSPGQFSLLCQYLNDAGLAKAWYLTTPGNKRRSEPKYTNLIAFEPDGPIDKAQYYYAGRSERSARISRGMLKAVRAFIAEKGRPDVIVCHASWAPPLFLFDELDIPIVTYLEFPSYHAHGWDPAYPPDEGQRLSDRNMEMVNLHAVLRSALTIMPSAYAKSMLPPELQSRVMVQYEGFDIAPDVIAPKPVDQPFLVGFAARDLSNAKGLEVYMRLVARLVDSGQAKGMRFIAVGDAKATTYGYEPQFVERHYKDKSKSYFDYLLEKYPSAAVIERPGKLPYDQFADRIKTIDLFLYPLRYGVANWGLMEILARGRPVIASARNFIPELVVHDQNGLLLPDDDDLWCRELLRLKKDPQTRLRLGQAASRTGEAYHISRVAPKFLSLFQRAMAMGNPPRSFGG